MSIEVGSEVVTVADAVANVLRRRLLAGRYPGGTEIRDTELSEEFSVSRATVRAAVQILVAEGLLVRGHGRSARVRSFTAEDSIDIYRLRTLLELNSIDTIIANSADLGEVAAALERFAILSDDVSWDEVADADINFHRAVVRASGSLRLLRTFEEISSESRLLIAQLQPVYRGASQLASEHAVLLDALKARNVQTAQSAWREHLAEGRTFSLEQVKERQRTIGTAE